VSTVVVVVGVGVQRLEAVIEHWRREEKGREKWFLSLWKVKEFEFEIGGTGV
jgi:hypothetical protein